MDICQILLYLFFMYLSLLYMTFYGMMAVAMTPNSTIAAIVSASFYGIWNLFSGFIIPRPVSSINPQHFCFKFEIYNLFFTYTYVLVHHFVNRGYLFGGDGTIGLVRLLGLSMVWLLHSLQTLKICLRMVKL